MLLEKDFPHDVRVEKEIDSLIEGGHTVSVACFSLKISFLKKEVLKNGCTVYRKQISPFIHKSSVGCLKFPFYFNFWRSFIYKILKSEQIDVIHIHDLPLGTIGNEMRRRFSIPFVIDLHENWPAAVEVAEHTNTILGRFLSSVALWRKYERKITQAADAVVVVVEEMKNRIAALGVDKSKIYVVENTLTESNIKQVVGNPNPDFLTLFYSGGINKHRGLQIVVSALPKVIEKFPNVRLWIAGDGSYVDQLKQLALNLDVETHIDFKGHLPYNEVFNMLMQSDIALIPHVKSEQTDNSSPNKLYEYMYTNKPILTSNCNSVQRVVEQEQIGIAYQHDNADDFAEKVEYIINNKTSFSNGLELIREKYLWNYSAKNLLKMYEDIKYK